MSGKPKQGIDYSGWSVDIFDSDSKIDKLLDAKGWKGFGIYFFLCQRAYKTNGYFYEWSYDDCATTARKMGGGINSGTVEETVRYCLQVDLFHQGLFDRWGILTSRGIQRRFWAVLSERRSKIVYKEYWLLPTEECNGLLKVSLKSDLQPTNEHLHPANGETLSRKESKVNKSKVNKKICSELKDSPRPDAAYNLPLIDGSFYSVIPEEVEKYCGLYPAVDTDQEFRKMIGWLDANPKNRKTKRGIQKFMNGWLARSQDSARPVNSTRPSQVNKNQFHNFEQRDTDYDAIALERAREQFGSLEDKVGEKR